jgi:hypothetical protein
LPIALAPLIEKIEPQSSTTWEDSTNPTTNITTSKATTTVTLKVTCRPDVLPEQEALLLFKDYELKAADRTTPTNTLNFEATIVMEYPPGAKAPTDLAHRTLVNEYVRLRVEGVDSVPLLYEDYEDITIAPQLKFDDWQQLTVVQGLHP